MGQKHGPVPEVLGDGGVGPDAAHGGEPECRLLAEEGEGGLELGVEEGELGCVALGVDFHLGLEGGEGKGGGGASRGGEGVSHGGGGGPAGGGGGHGG